MFQKVFLTDEQQNGLFIHVCPFCGYELQGDSTQDEDGVFQGHHICDFCCLDIEWEWDFFDDFNCYLRPMKKGEN